MCFQRLLSKPKIQFIAVFLFCCVSCVYVPYPVPANVGYIDDVPFPEGAILTIGPRELLADVAESITNTDSHIVVVDGEQFRDTAFPEGDWTLKNMLKPETCHRIKEELYVDYLVIVSTKGLIVGEEEGFFVPMAIGAMTVDEEMTIDAMILDLNTGTSVCQISSEAHGTGKLFHWVIYIAATGPMTETSAITGLGATIANVIREHTKSEKVRIAIMAAEFTNEPSLSSTYEADLNVLPEKSRQGDKQAQWRLYELLPTKDRLVCLCREADLGDSKGRNELGGLIYMDQINIDK